MRPVWKKISDANMPANLLPWLANTDSMTRALEEASGVECQIQVLREDWDLPLEDESDYLNSTLSSCRSDQLPRFWIREVVLATHKPVMFARSVFPRKLLEQFPQLMNLGSQPLGKILFSADNMFQRGPIEVAEISTGDFLWEQIPSTLRPKTCWARRSIFHTAISSFLLSEVFLP